MESEKHHCNVLAYDFCFHYRLFGVYLCIEPNFRCESFYDFLCNTIIAIFLGWLVADEPVDSNFVIAAFLIILGIFITNYHPDMFKTKKH